MKTTIYAAHIKRLKAEVVQIKAAIQPLETKLTKLEWQLRRLQSKAFIIANNIKKKDVEMSSGGGQPYHYTLPNFIKWLKGKDQVKKWTEWNEFIYHTSDLMNNRMPEMPGRTWDL